MTATNRARHRAPAQARTPWIRAKRGAGRTVAAVGMVVALAGVGGPSVTSASFTDSARAMFGVGASSSFPCRATVFAPFEFAQAPVDQGSGVWTYESALCSPNGRWLAVFQIDGNFVLYDMSTYPGKAVVASWTFREDVGGVGQQLIFQADGNLVIYGASGALRHTGTNGAAGAALTLGDDGNLRLTDNAGVVRWQSVGTQTLDCRVPGAFTCDPNTPGGPR